LGEKQVGLGGSVQDGRQMNIPPGWPDEDDPDMPPVNPVWIWIGVTIFLLAIAGEIWRDLERMR
jgi:hypothetical protein